MDVRIRAMRSQDYRSAYALWETLPGIGLSSADRQDALASFLERNSDTCFVAEDGEAIIGTILGGSDGRRGYIYHLAVQGDHQKQGVGKRLLQSCLDALRKQGIEKCHIFVIADNQEGFKFWQKQGWEPRDDILVMSKNLI